MILYNVTVKVDHAVHADWKDWMKNTHIPDVMATGKFREYKMCRLISVAEEDGVTYAIQYFSPDLATFQQYQQEDAPRLQAENRDRYGDQFVAFRTLLEVEG